MWNGGREPAKKTKKKTDNIETELTCVVGDIVRIVLNVVVIDEQMSPREALVFVAPALAWAT